MEEFFSKLDAMYGAGRLNEIEGFIKRQLARMQAEGETGPDYATVVNELGAYYRGGSHYPESEKCFNEALEIMETSGLGETKQTATMMLNLAGTYRMTGRYALSEAKLLEAVALLEKIHMESDYAYVAVLNQLSLVYQGQGEYAKAIEVTKKVLGIVRQYAAENKHEIATALGNLASACIAIKRLDEAQAYAEEAKEVFESMPTQSIHYPAVFSILGSIYFYKEDYGAALRNLERSLQLTEHYFGKNKDYAMVENNLARVLEAKGDLPQALSHQKLATAIMERTLGPQNKQTQLYQKQLTALEKKVQG